MPTKKVMLALCLCLQSLLTPQARADEGKVSAADISSAALAAAAWALPSIYDERLVRENQCPCQSSGINPIDRPYAGRRIEPIAKASDALLGASLLSAPIVYASLVPQALDGGMGAPLLVDGVLLFKLLAWNGLLNQTAKYTVQRPRPYAYADDASPSELTEPEAYVSFYSGHTATMFAATFGLSEVLRYRLPNSKINLLTMAMGGTLSTVVAFMRVSSGKHFPTDVLVGALAGTVIGFGVPYLKHNQIALEIVPTPQGLTLNTTYSF